jgi:two-component system, OmpR family, KDP operon response regulator KdpE
MSSLLVIDDEPDIHRVLRPVLTGAGWEVLGAMTAAHGLRVARANTVKVVLLDLGLPDADGKEIIDQLQTTNPLSIIVISARHQDLEKVAALDAGADDYVDKPFNIEELLARIRVAERRAGSWVDKVEQHSAGGLLLDTAKRRVTLAGEDIKLSPKEFDLLRELISNAGQVVTHRRLLMAGWGDVTVDPQYLRSYIATLRQKLEADPSEPQILRSEPGVGYRLAG